MLTAIQGTYENGQIILDEVPPAQKRAGVVVTFLDEKSLAERSPRKAGVSVKRGSLPADFNEPPDNLEGVHVL